MGIEQVLPGREIATPEPAIERPRLPRLDENFSGFASSYVIATTCRTGSYLLCDALSLSNVGGEPVEAFCPQYRQLYCQRWEIPLESDFEPYFQAVIRNGLSPNGVFGIKVHRCHLEPLTEGWCRGYDEDDILPALFPAAKYVHLFRRDTRAQAISLYRAQATDEWWRIRGEANPFARRERPAFDAAEILRLEQVLREQNAGWEAFFVHQRIVPLRLEYEVFEKNYQGEIARVLEFLGQDPQRAEALPEPRLVRQRDRVTDLWLKLLDEQQPVTSRI
jgi:LPS sulfotransferase NodH